jgi:hypothetical protein
MQFAWVRLREGSRNGNAPNFDGNTLPPAISVVRRAQLTFRPALQSAASLALQSAHRYDRYRLRLIGGGVIFGFDKLIGFNLRGGAYYCAY